MTPAEQQVVWLQALREAFIAVAVSPVTREVLVATELPRLLREAHEAMDHATGTERDRQYERHRALSEIRRALEAAG